VYGGSVEYVGEVVGIGMGTGAAFALLPPQNASGNWIKIVQRVPVRIRLNPQQLAEHPLRVGLSMRVRVDLRKDGPQLAPAPRSAPVFATVATTDAMQAEELVRSIIAAHSGRAETPLIATPPSEPGVASVVVR
jgi:membrane fusion protein (multidrug efflux system)